MDERDGFIQDQLINAFYEFLSTRDSKENRKFILSKINCVQKPMPQLDPAPSSFQNPLHGTKLGRNA